MMTRMRRIIATPFYSVNKADGLLRPFAMSGALATPHLPQQLRERASPPITAGLRYNPLRL
jgi:hypothetical protein